MEIKIQISVEEIRELLKKHPNVSGQDLNKIYIDLQNLNVFISNQDEENEK